MPPLPRQQRDIFCDMHDVLLRREAARSPYEQNVLVVDESEEEKIYTPVGEDTNLPARSDNIERLASLAYGWVESSTVGAVET